MNPLPVRADRAIPATHVPLLLALLGLEVAAPAALFGWYRAGSLPWSTVLHTRTGVLTIAALVIALVAAAATIRLIARGRRTRPRDVALTVAMNAIMVGAIVLTLEVAARLAVRRAGDNEMLLGQVLPPRRWDWAVERYRAVLARGGGHLSYLVYDSTLGWTVGPDRTSADSLYAASVEGIRAPRQGMRYGDRHPRRRIVLVGDSNTFGEESRYDDTWGHGLELALGADHQVLNLGVPGYGTDQAFLRYQRDGLPWHPDVVVFGVHSHDLQRAMAVYTFLSFPDWDFPFSKPRFVVRDGALTAINLPTIAPAAVFGHTDVASLPYLEHDPGYDPREWARGPLDWLYVPRLLRARFPRWHAVRDPFADSAIALNAAILERFWDSAERARVQPVLVFLPSRAELDAGAGDLSPGERAVLASHLTYVDTRPCLRTLPRGERFLPSGHHYTPRGNRAVLECLLPAVRGVLRAMP